MARSCATLALAALLMVPPALWAQSVLGRGGGNIGVLGPASAFANAPSAPPAVAGAVHGMARSAMARPPTAIAAAANGCSIYGFIGGISGNATLNSIGVFDLTAQPALNLGTAQISANAAGGALQANVGATAQGTIAGQVQRSAGTLLTVATTTRCGAGTAFNTQLTSSPAGSGNTVVASAGPQQIQATYAVSYQYDANNPYYCYYNNQPNRTFLCNIFYAQTSFNFLTSTFPAQGAGTYALNIVQANVSVQ